MNGSMHCPCCCRTPNGAKPCITGAASPRWLARPAPLQVELELTVSPAGLDPSTPGMDHGAPGRQGALPSTPREARLAGQDRTQRGRKR